MRTAENPLALAIAAVASLYAWAVVALTPTHPGAIGLNLNALGTDWMVFYGGAERFFHGGLAWLFDGARFTAYLNATFSGWLSAPMAYRPWVYPPSYLLVVLPFGKLSFAQSYVVFQAASAASLAGALWFRAERPHSRTLVLLSALFGPAAAINAAMGQNAFLIAALLVAGFRLLPQRPVLGGILLGLITIKPQFALLVPVALAAAREWRAFFWFVVAALALVLASAAVFGIDCWRHWIGLALTSFGNPHGKWVEFGRMWGISIYACLRSAGASATVANGVGAAGALVGAALVYRTFRLRLPRDQRLVVLLAATVLVAPHASLHDLVLLAVAAALWICEPIGRSRPLTEWMLALALLLAPLFNPPLVSPVGRLTPVLILLFVGVALTQARRAVAPTFAADPILSAPATQPP